jgi:hypothetical protein
MYLQANFLYQPDELFTNNQTCMLPVFSVNRAGNLTEETANKYLSSLYTAFKVKTALLIVGIVVAVAGVIMFGFGVYRLKKLKAEAKSDKVSLIDEKLNENEDGNEGTHTKEDFSLKEELLVKEEELE